METTQFKTNIKCEGCVAKVTPYLNDALGENNWQVDYNNPAKLLTVTGESDPAKVTQALEKAGYKGEKI